MAVWFTVRLDDRPGSLARLAGALGTRGVNITGIVGVAEDTDGTLMLTTSDADTTRAVLTVEGIAFEAHDSAALATAGGPPAVRQGLADQGFHIDQG
ncbi:MAG: ACT domain-containing protein [Candidatus Limnocylindrales bacterium]